MSFASDRVMLTVHLCGCGQTDRQEVNDAVQEVLDLLAAAEAEHAALWAAAEAEVEAWLG